METWDMGRMVTVTPREHAAASEQVGGQEWTKYQVAGTRMQDITF